MKTRGGFKTVYFLCLVFIFLGVVVPLWAQESSGATGDIGSAIKDFSKLSDGDKNMVLDVYGLPSQGGWDLGKLAANFIFGAIGFVAFIYGKKNSFWRTMTIGIVLMGYSYFISSTVAIYSVGVALTAALYFWRD